jgi:peptidoglycan/LPS O-acetylase OafA/YrhL
MRYRAEIDGLRTLAVIPVILFHAGFHVLGGGFVGVDIFFVISGYLITGILLAELNAGRFSILNFYERRARRILPALFLVLLVSVPCAWYVLLPHDFKGFASSLAAVSIFGSNILFWGESGYFDSAAELKPLLHTWSLAVEEQYYIFFPPLLAVLYRWCRHRLVLVLLGMSLLSLALAQWTVVRMPNAAFFLLPPRMWELLVGALAAVHVAKPGAVPMPLSVRQALSLSGAALIGYAMVCFDGNTPFPGLYALPPTAGAALLILFADEGTWMHRLLSLRGMVTIGLISYSAYLWHQPLFAFAKYASDTTPSKTLMAALVVLTLLLAYGSWRYIEAPFRHKSKFDRRQIFVLGLVGIAVFLGVGQLVRSGRLVARFERAQPLAIPHLPPDSALASEPCPGFPEEAGFSCKLHGQGHKLVAVWGDSHAIAMGYYVPKTFLPPDTRLLVMGNVGCPPFLGVVRSDKQRDASHCLTTDALIKQSNYIASLRPDVLVMVGRWTLYLNGGTLTNTAQRYTYLLAVDEQDPGTVEGSRAAFAQGVRNTITRIAAPRVLVLGQAPEPRNISERRMQREALVDRAAIDAYHAVEEDAFARLAPELHFQYLNPRPHFCEGTTCPLRFGPQPIYSDSNHLQTVGTYRMWDILGSALFK